MYPMVKTIRNPGGNQYVRHIRVSGFAIRKLLQLKLIESVRVSNSPFDPTLPTQFEVGKKYKGRKFTDWDSLVMVSQSHFNGIRLFYWLEYSVIEMVQEKIPELIDKKNKKGVDRKK